MIHLDELDICNMCGSVITFDTKPLHMRWYDRLQRRIFQAKQRTRA